MVVYVNLDFELDGKFYTCSLLSSTYICHVNMNKLERSRRAYSLLCSCSVLIRSIWKKKKLFRSSYMWMKVEVFHFKPVGRGCLLRWVSVCCFIFYPRTTCFVIFSQICDGTKWWVEGRLYKECHRWASTITRNSRFSCRFSCRK